MGIWRFLLVLCLGLGIVAVSFGAVPVSYGAPKKGRILVVSSYHREYLWSQSTQAGLCAAMLKYGYLDNKEQGDAFKKKTLELSQQVDAFFVLNHDTLKDDQGNAVDMLVVGKWYLEHIKKPETSLADQFVQEGMLCTANDSGYNQGYEAFSMAIEILEKEVKPGRMRPRTPLRGPLMVNRKRAKMLGISLEDKMEDIEEIIEDALALK